MARYESNVTSGIHPGCDDAVILAMALGSDDLEVASISTVAGNSTVESTTQLCTLSSAVE